MFNKKKQKMTITKEKTIGEIVADDYRTAQIFKKHQIDFCCKGNRSVESVCEKNNIVVDQLMEEIEGIKVSNDNDVQVYKTWPADLLADYIEKKHHRYVEEKIPVIVPFLEKLCKVHGERHPELFDITAHFKNSATELGAHMKKEELVLFPFIRKMVEAKQAGKKVEAPHFGTVENPVEMMKHEHDTEGERFRQIALLSNNYTPPADGCTTYRVTFAMLQEFEEDLHLHIHLENNILFPEALRLEKELRA